MECKENYKERGKGIKQTVGGKTENIIGGTKKTFRTTASERRSDTKRAGRRKRLALENNEIKPKIKERFGRKKDGQMEKERRKESRHREEGGLVPSRHSSTSLIGLAIL